MTAQNPQIQALIQEIDEVLHKTNPRLPWVMSNDALQQRQVLEQTRRYLSSLQQTEPQAAAEKQPEAAPAPIAPAPATASVTPTPTEVAPAELDEPAYAVSPTTAYAPPPQPQPAYTESAQQVLQAVLQEMNYLRFNMLQPLRSDVEMLQRQREALTHEVRQLEAQRQQYAYTPQPINQQLLMEFLQTAMGQMQENLKGQVAQMLATFAAQTPQEPPLLTGSPEAALSPVQRLEHLQTVQAQSDQLLMKLDTTLRVLFDSVQRNVQSYQDSLEEGLHRLYRTGQQSEALFALMMQRLATQMGQEGPAAFPSSGTTEADLSQILAELNALKAKERRSAAPPDALADLPADPRWQPPEPISPTADPGNIEALRLELNQLDLNAVSPESLSFESEASLLDDDQALAALLNPAEPQVPETELPPPSPVGSSLDDELESALDLLNQISSSAEADAPSTLATNPLPDSPSFEPSVPSVELIDDPDRLYDDAFYQNLLNEEGIADLTAPPLHPAPEAESPLPLAEAPLIEENWFDEFLKPEEADRPAESANDVPATGFPAPDSLQSMEAFLRGEPSAPPADSTFDWPGSAIEPAASPERPEPMDVIAQLTDLIPQSSDADPSNTASPISLEAAFLNVENTAAPPHDQREPQAQREQHETSADLFAMDAEPASDFLPETNRETADWTLEAWANTVTPPEGESSSREEALFSEPAEAGPADAFTLEGLESLFENVPAHTSTAPTNDSPEPPAAETESETESLTLDRLFGGESSEFGSSTQPVADPADATEKVEKKKS